MLEIKSLSKVFNPNTVNELVLYDNLNLQVKQGEFVTIIGSNGSGKSTLFNLICGTLDPDHGSIMLDSTNLLKIPEYQRLKRFARVYQDPQKGTAPSLTILENLAIAANKNMPFNLTKAVDKAQIEFYRALLKPLALGLEDKLNVQISSLSGGQRQALALLMVTMGNPELLLLDEHTAALDPKTSEKIVELTEKIVHQHQTTTLMITHNLKHAINLGNRLLMFHKGKIILDIEGATKKSLTVQSLIERFNQLNMTDELSDEMAFSQ
ncbi:Energy-coupling factor transporter ATP-binding protein EcfA1 [bioreactor metagenome]|uniref:Energy-coupling factor transporter ATP-binding protein EcfA1 n=1 Tax=bioreactor metagenome TaxID=1076179 RepID=A0A645BH81_9ZZZZ|nr:ATP-binding cassette domain-containing protein [Erysipelotrichaceae bacterium]